MTQCWKVRARCSHMVVVEACFFYGRGLGFRATKISLSHCHAFLADRLSLQMHLRISTGLHLPKPLILNHLKHVGFSKVPPDKSKALHRVNRTLKGCLEMVFTFCLL